MNLNGKVWQSILHSQNLFKGTEAGHLILGSIESVKSFDRDSFVKFHEKHYVADNATIVISGKFDEEAVLKKVIGGI